MSHGEDHAARHATGGDDVLTPAAIGVPIIIELSFTGDNSPDQETSDTAYSVAARFRFPGTDKIGTPSKIYAICSGNGKVKIRDLTNSQDICEKTNAGGVGATINDLGTLSNLPASPAIFEVHFAAAMLTTLNLSSLTVEI